LYRYNITVTAYYVGLYFGCRNETASVPYLSINPEDAETTGAGWGF
jgi:hypothetical protein